MQLQDIQAERTRLDGAGLRQAAVAAVVGVIGLGAAVGLAAADPGGSAVFFRSYLASFLYFLSLALGALFFVLTSHLTRAGWSVAVRRVAEVVGWNVVPLAVLALVIVFGVHDLYEWAHDEAVAGDVLLQHKQGFLNVPFFTARLAFYFAAWIVMAVFLLRTSAAQDRTGDPRLTRRLETFAPVAAIVYALTVTFAAFDLIMSLYPHWYSTIFGVYYFSGGAVGFFALQAVLLSVLRGGGRLRRIVGTEHDHDLGKLMFAFVVFWAYIAFSQYMLIWYGNLPEETVWFLRRQSGPWTAVSLLLLFGHFLLPFLALMSRHPKRRRGALVAAAVWLLVVHWFDVLWLVMPEARPDGPAVRWIDVACLVGLGGLFFAATFWRLGRSELVPVRDPRLPESLGFENV